MIDGMKRLLTYAQVAEILGVKINTLYWWVHTNRIPHTRLGPRCVRFEQEQLTTWVADKSTVALISCSVHLA